MAEKDSAWTAVYETRSQLDADLVRTSLEVAGYRVSIEAPSTPSPFMRSVPEAITVAVPAEDADDARDFLRQKTNLLSNAGTAALTDEVAEEPESIEAVAGEVLALRRQHEIAACKYCGIPTLDVSEAELDSHKIAILRAAGLGVNSATFSEFQAGERICTDCAGHEVSCDLCGRTLDAFLDEGQYRQASEDEAYVCSQCMQLLEDQLERDRDW